MVGWGFAFGRGIVIFLWTIVWAIVAGIIAVVITGGTLITAFSNPTAIASNPTAFLSAFLLGFFLSAFIAIIGFYATVVKVTVDGTISQLEKSGMIGRSSFSMGVQPTLTAPPSAPMLKKYCPNCGNSIPGGTIKCPSCGAAI